MKHLAKCSWSHTNSVLGHVGQLIALMLEMHFYTLCVNNVSRHLRRCSNQSVGKCKRSLNAISWYAKPCSILHIAFVTFWMSNHGSWYWKLCRILKTSSNVEAQNKCSVNHKLTLQNCAKMSNKKCRRTIWSKEVKIRKSHTTLEFLASSSPLLNLNHKCKPRPLTSAV